MKVLLILLTLVQVGFGSPSLEVRAYLAPVEGFIEPKSDRGGWINGNELIDLSEFYLVKEPPFESRFFKEGDVLKDLTRWAVEMDLAKDGSETVVWNETTGRLVVRADDWRHRGMVAHFKDFLEVEPRVGIELLKVKGITLEPGELVLSNLPEGTEKVAGVTLKRDGGEWHEVRLQGSGLSLEIADCWNDMVVWELGLSLGSRIPGSKFEIKGGFTGIMGEPMVVEVGSRGGRDTLVAVIKVEGVLGGGVLLRDWVQEEDGGQKWWKRALTEAVAPWGVPALDGDRKVRRRFTVPPAFKMFLGSGDEEDERLGVKELLMRNGVGFEKGDHVIFYEKSLVLEVVAGPMAIELIEGIISAGGSSTIRMIRGSLALVEGTEKLTQEKIKMGAFRVRDKINCDLLPGQMSKVALGRKRIILEVEAQIDSEDSVVEMRYDLKTRVGGDLRSGGEFQVDRPVIIHQAKAGKKWRAWVLTASILRAEDYLEKE